MYHNTIPGWLDFHAIYAGAVEFAQDDDIFVELGSFMGKSAAYMMEQIQRSGKRIPFYAVDLWKALPGDTGAGHMPWGEPIIDFDSRLGGDKLFEVCAFYLRLSPAASCLTEMIQSDAAKSADRFADNSVRFVFVDASHSYEDVKNDLAAWWPKIKADGVLAGHDWTNPEVQQAIREFALSQGCATIGLACGNSWVIEKTPAISFELSPFFNAMKRAKP